MNDGRKPARREARSKRDIWIEKRYGRAALEAEWARLDARDEEARRTRGPLTRWVGMDGRYRPGRSNLRGGAWVPA